MVSACSKEEPEPKIFMQVSSISDESGSISQQITYDSYGRVTSFECMYQNESIVALYEYISDNLIKITTRDETYWSNGEINTLTLYEDELHLENGRAVSCDGTFSWTQQDKSPFEKKYRQEFSYTPQNYLNTVKWTEWNDKRVEDKPVTWENYYHWENGNLTKIEDFLGHSYPYITYSFKYSDIAGVQNVLPIPMSLPQYFPLQLKGIFGSMPTNLIMEVNRADNLNSRTTSYRYDITEGRITGYQELYENEVKNTFSVQWSK